MIESRNRYLLILRCGNSDKLSKLKQFIHFVSLKYDFQYKLSRCNYNDKLFFLVLDFKYISIHFDVIVYCLIYLFNGEVQRDY